MFSDISSNFTDWGHQASDAVSFSLLSVPQVGFLRFLYLISTFDWKNNPLIVNLNSELTGKW